MKFSHILHKSPQPHTKSKDKIFDFLNSHKTGVLATTDPNNNPHAAAIYYSIDDVFMVRFLTKKGTKKSDNLAHNNHAMLVVYDEKTQTTAQIIGKVEAISNDKETHKVFMQVLRSSLDTAESAIPPISRIDAGDHIGYELKPVEVKMTVFKRSTAVHRGSKLETFSVPALNFSN